MFRKLLIFLLITLIATNPATANDQIYKKYQTQIKQIEDYFNNSNSFSANFVQIIQNNILSGKIYLQKPQKMRFEYEEPSPIVVVANGRVVTYYDKELDEISHIPAKKTPVKFLALKNLSFKDQGFEVIDFQEQDNAYKITIEDTSNQQIENFSLFFSQNPFLLNRIEISNELNQNISISLFNHKFNTKFDKKLFSIKDPVLPK